jgi:hypothetical protein
MARRTAAASKTAAPRGPSATSVKGSEAAPASPGMGLAEVLAITTTLLLVAAILMTDYYLGHKLGSGVFMKP